MPTYNETEYASKGVAGAGLGLGIAGTALGLLNNNNGNGLLGLFGNNGWNNGVAGMAAQAAGCAVNDKFSSLEAEIAKLKAEKHSDLHDIEVYKQTREENKELQDRLLGNWIKPLADEAANNRVEIAKIKADVAKNAEITELKFQLAEQKAATAQAATNGVIFSLQAQVGELLCMTRRHIPATNVCPLPMPRYNQWSVDPLAAGAPDGTATAASAKAAV